VDHRCKKKPGKVGFGDMSDRHDRVQDVREGREVQNPQ